MKSAGDIKISEKNIRSISPALQVLWPHAGEKLRDKKGFTVDRERAVVLSNYLRKATRMHKSVRLNHAWFDSVFCRFSSFLVVEL